MRLIVLACAFSASTAFSGATDMSCDARSLISRHEGKHMGKRLCVYKDTRGIPTIGIGYNLQNPGARAALASVCLCLSVCLCRFQSPSSGVKKVASCRRRTPMDAKPAPHPFPFRADTVDSFPPAFLSFLERNGIHADNYRIVDVPRFVRLNPRATLCRAELERQLGTGCEPVPWLTDFYQLRGDVKIAGSDAYRAGIIYGIDVSSGAAVQALDPQPGEHVLDLCCAPGAKLCFIADRMGLTGSVTGVDVCAERLAACRTLCQKYGVENARLFVADGTTFCVPPPPATPVVPAAGAGPHDQQPRTKRQRATAAAAAAAAAPDGSMPFFVGASLLPAATPEAPQGQPAAAAADTAAAEPTGAVTAAAAADDAADAAPPAVAGPGTGAAAGASSASAPGGAPVQLSRRGYDRVLVDAECTHDGSIKHLAKFASWGWDSFERKFLQPGRLEALAALQAALLRNGFARLRPGGTLVYSTCSFARAQNEDIVAAFLSAEPRARLLPADEALRGAPCLVGEPAGGGGGGDEAGEDGGAGRARLAHTIRFEPRSSHTSALFIAIIGKAEEG